MTKITIDIPEEISFIKDKISQAEWSFLATRLLQSKIRKVIEYNRIISKSQATDEDVEELSSEIKEAVWKRHSNTNYKWILLSIQMLLSQQSSIKVIV